MFRFDYIRSLSARSSVRRTALASNPVSPKRNLEIRVRPRPDQGKPRHPILAIDRLPRALVLFRRKDARGRGKFRPGDLSADRTGRDLHARIIPNAFRLAHVVPSHHINLSVLFPEPYRCGNSNARLAESRQRNVFLVANCEGYLTCHEPHSSRTEWENCYETIAGG